MPGRPAGGGAMLRRCRSLACILRAGHGRAAARSGRFQVIVGALKPAREGAVHYLARPGPGLLVTSAGRRQVTRFGPGDHAGRLSLPGLAGGWQTAPSRGGGTVSAMMQHEPCFGQVPGHLAGQAGAPGLAVGLKDSSAAASVRPASSRHVAARARCRGCAAGVRPARAGAHCPQQEGRSGIASGSPVTAPLCRPARRGARPRCGRCTSRRSPDGGGPAGSCRRLESRWLLFSTVQVRPGGFACPGHGDARQAGSARRRSLGACAVWPGRRPVFRLDFRADTVARGVAGYQTGYRPQ